MLLILLSIFSHKGFCVEETAKKSDAKTTDSFVAIADSITQDAKSTQTLVKKLPLNPTLQADIEGAKTEIKGIMVKGLLGNLENHNKVVKIVDTVEQNNLNTIFLQVRANGNAFYKSVTEPFAFSTLGYGYKDENLNDPLKDILDICKKGKKDGQEPIEVIAAFETLKAGSVNQNPLLGNIATDQPQWVNKNFDGKTNTENGEIFLDYNIPQVRDYVTAVILEVVKDYDIDGVFLDGLYNPEPNTNWGYTDIAVNLFNQEMKRSGKPEKDDPVWNNWRRKNLTALVKQIYSAIIAEKPETKVIVGCIADGDAPLNDLEFTDTIAYKQYFQNWIIWGYKEYMDYLCLLNFKKNLDQKEAVQFDKWNQFSTYYKSDTELIVGVAGYKNFPNDLLNQVRLVYDSGVSKNVVLFDYNNLTIGSSEELLTGLSNSVFSSDYQIYTEAPIEPKQLSPETEAVDEVVEEPVVEIIDQLPPPDLLDTPEGIAAKQTARKDDFDKIITNLPPPEVSEETNIAQSQSTKRSSEEILETVNKASASAPVSGTYYDTFYKWDNILLKNGNRLEGKIKEQSGDKTTIILPEGSIIKINTSDIDKVETAK